MKTKKITVTQAQLNAGDVIVDLSLASPSFDGFNLINRYSEFILPNTVTFTNTSGVALGYVLVSTDEKEQYDSEAFSFIQIALDKAVFAGATATGLANDSTAYTATVTDNNGVTTAISIVGSAAQTYTNLITELNSDLTGIAVASLYGVGGTENGIKILSGTKTRHLRITDSGANPLLAALGITPASQITYADYEFTPLTIANTANFEGSKLLSERYLILSGGGSATGSITIECSDYHRSNRI